MGSSPVPGVHGRSGENHWTKPPPRQTFGIIEHGTHPRVSGRWAAASGDYGGSEMKPESSGGIRKVGSEAGGNPSSTGDFEL